MSQVEAGESGRRRAERGSSKGDGRLGRATIRERNEAKLLKAAEAVFARKGFSGASTAEIARRAGIPKANLHYYFRTKQRLYAAVLDDILEIWVDALGEIRAEADPADAIRRYIACKMESSRLLPLPSRLWAMELLGGGRHVQPFLKGRLRRLVEQKSAVIRGWITAGKIDEIAPAHLLFALWAMTQTYADFATQIAAVLGKDRLDNGVFADATATLTALVLKGLSTGQPAAVETPIRRYVGRANEQERRQQRRRGTE
jgi:TetR/AcrR family transcriptional regulator